MISVGGDVRYSGADQGVWYLSALLIFINSNSGKQVDHLAKYPFFRFRVHLINRYLKYEA
jgi:hypothetical protein